MKISRARLTPGRSIQNPVTADYVYAPCQNTRNTI